VELPPRDQAAAFFVFFERFSSSLRITPQRPDRGRGFLGKGNQSLSAAARRALGSSFFKFVNVKSSIPVVRNETSVIPNMSDVPTTQKKKSMRQEQNSGAKNIAVVQCDGFRCLAYREADAWRDFQTGKELPEVQSVVFTFSI
jgi:hypothetical protein